MSDQNGIIQSPFSDAISPPSPTEGDQGTGGGLTSDPGPQGIIASPFDKAIVPTPSSLNPPEGPFGNPARMSKIGGKTFEGESLAGDITLPPHNTIDKK